MTPPREGGATDVFDRATRSRVMRAVKGRDTKPEWRLRRALHAKGFRYRLHRRDLPGSPDLVFPARRAVIFVHGCFWHGHNCPRGAREPKTNAEYWRAKIARNRARDAKVVTALRAKGWAVHVVWECALNDLPRAVDDACAFLDLHAPQSKRSKA